MARVSFGKKGEDLFNGHVGIIKLPTLIVTVLTFFLLDEIK